MFNRSHYSTAGRSRERQNGYKRIRLIDCKRFSGTLLFPAAQWSVARRGGWKHKMIVVMAAKATEEQIKDVEKRIQDWGYGVHPIYGTERTVIGAVGVPEADKARYMESLE